MTASDRLISVRELCGILGISRATYQKLKRVGKFPLPQAKQALTARQRYRLSDAQKYVSEGRVQ